MDVFVARQPIFDRDLKIVGYELLHRREESLVPASATGEDLSGSTGALAAVAGMGLDRITGGSTVFVGADAATLRGETLDLLSPEHVIIEPLGLESEEESDALLALCRDIQGRGFRIAVDAGSRSGSILGMADVIRVDVTAFGPDGTLDAAHALKQLRGRLLAFRVETAGILELCRSAGFELFQGFHFFRPETLSRKDLSTESVAVLRLLTLLREDQTTDAVILETFRSDPALSYKLLRLVNSAALGGRGIQSIEFAVRLLGREPLYRWLSLLLVRSQGDGGGPREELIHSSLLRARMCELVGASSGSAFARNLPDRGGLFLVGLFSHMDMLMGAPLEEILDQVDLARDAREALLHRTGAAGHILEAIESYQQADWDRAEALLAAVGGNPETLGDAYLDAVTWARNRMVVHEG